MTTPPPGPGWNGHQQPDAAWNTDPLYDDTGWHLDLSELHGVEASPRLDPLPEPASTEHSAFPFQPPYNGNGVAAGNSGSDWLTASPAGPQDRPAGRHARHARPAEDGAASPPRDYQPQGYQPAEYEYPESSSPLARYSYPDRTAYPERPATEPRGHPRYPESASPLARYSYPDPPAYQPYAEPEAPAPPPDRYRQYDQYQQYEQHDQHEQYERPVAQARPMNPTLALESMMPAPLAVEAIPAAPLPAETTGTQSASILRSSGVMAVGTLGSRLTGFLRTIAQSYALGALGIAEAYNLSNTLPNVVYNLALGGILTSVIVPLIVNSKKRDADRGEAYEQRMFTLVTALLLGVTVLATLAAVPIVHLYSGSAITGKTEHIAIIFAFFFIPQIFFYGVSSLIGAVLNTRGSFAAPMWTPIINNFVVIGVLGLYVAMAGLDKNPATITGTEVDLLGVGTTLGIIAQTAALVPALRKVGFRWQPRTDFHRAEVREIGRMAGWMLCYIGATQVAFLITTKIAGDVASGITYYNYAWLLFQLPYAVVGISVITALLPRMSAHASEGRLGLVRTDFSAGIRLASAIVVPCSLVLAVLGPPIAELFLAHGATTPAQGRDMGVVFAVFCLGLLPYMVFQLQLRVFYSLHDSKTPALIGLVTMSVNIAANVIAAHSLHNTELVAGLGVGFGLANLLGTAIAWRILSRRVGGLDGRAIGGAVARMYAATVPAAMLALLVSLLVDHVVTGARGAALLAIMLGGGGALLVYVLFARSLRITELTSLSRTVLSRLGR